MDKDMRQSLKDIAQAERLKDEEAYKGDNIARSIEINEEIEEKEYLLEKVKKQYRLFRGSFFVGLVVLVLVLMYMVYEIVSLPDTTKTDNPKPVVTEKPVPTPEPLKQSVTDTDLIYQLGLPDIDKSKIKKTTLGKLVKTLGNKDVLKYNNVDYYAGGTGYIYKDDKVESVSIQPGVEVLSLSSLEKLVGKSNKVYNIVDNPSDITSKKASNKSYCNIVRKNTLETYYNKDILKKADLKDSILASKEYNFTIQVYDDELSEDYIKGLLEGFTYNKAYKSYEDVIKAIANKLFDDINKFTISYEDYTFSYYDKVVEKDNKVVGIKGDREETPEKVSNYNITDIEVVYDTLACAWQEGWY